VYEGRGWDAEGAHATGHNDQSIGIAIIGDFNGRLPNTATLNAAKELILCGVIMVSLNTCLVFVFHVQWRSNRLRGYAMHKGLPAFRRPHCSLSNNFSTNYRSSVSTPKYFGGQKSIRSNADN